MPEVLEPSVHERRNRKECLQLCHAGEKAEHGAYAVEWLRAQTISDYRVIDRPDLVHESVEVGRVLGIEAFHLRLHALRVAHVVDVRSIMEVDPVVRIERHQIDVVGEAPVGCGENRVDNMGGSDQAGPHIEGVSLVAQLIRAATECVTLFQQGDIHT